MKITNPRTYSFVTGLILFLLGIFGFAFHSSVSVPDGYLFLSLILGFWGIVVSVYQ